MRRRAALVAALFVAVAAVVGWRSRGDPTSIAQPTAPRAEPRNAVHRYGIGAELTYALHYESDGTMDVGGEGAARLSSSFRARLVRTVVADAPRAGHLVLYRFVDAEVLVAINASNAADAASGVASALAEGVLAEESADGHILSLRSAASASPLALSFARTLLGGLQVTLPERMSPTWSARETDDNGEYIASYTSAGERQPASVELALRKTKRPAKSAAEQGDWAALTRDESRTSGTTEIDFDLVRGTVKEIASEQTVHSMLGDLEVATTKTKLDAERTGERVLDGPALQALLLAITALREAAPSPLSARAPALGETAKTTASKHWLGKTTFPELVTALRVSEGRAHDDRHFDLFLKLHAFTFLHPEECARVTRLLPPLDPNGSSFQVLVASLGATGSTAAQAALVAALRASEMSQEAKKHILATLGMVTFPGEAAESALRSVRDGSAPPELAATAALGLGIMAKTLASRSPKRTSFIVDEALTKANADERDEARLLLDLSVLGNTASPRIQHDVLRWSHVGSASVRAQATFALRLVKTEEAEARLLEVLAGDDDPAVRSRMATALSYREASGRSLQVQRARAASDPDSGVRAALLRNLYAMRELFPDVLGAIDERRRGDPDDRVKQIADGLLASTADASTP